MPTSSSGYTYYAKVPLPSTTMTVNIKTVLTHQYRIRLWCGINLLRLAAWVLGCNIVIESASNNERDATDR